MNKNVLLKAVSKKSTAITSNAKKGQYTNVVGEESNSISYFIYLMNKVSKTSSEMTKLSEFLKAKLENFFINIKEVNTNFSETEEKDLIKQLALNIQYQFFPIHTKVYNYGDFGEHFYLILKGQVVILVLTEEKPKMSELEYLNYLTNLQKLNEFELIRKTIYMNKKIYRCDNFIIKNDDLLRPKKKNSTLAFNPTKLNISIPKEIKDFQRKNLERRQTLNEQSGLGVDKAKKENLISQEIIEKETYEKYIKKRRYEEFIKNDDKDIKRNEVSIYCYRYLKTLYEGDTFGEIALESAFKRRQATILASENCHTGFFSKKQYDKFFKEVIGKIKKNRISSLCTIDLFSSFNKNNFIYYQYFGYCEIKLNTKVINENQEVKNIYFPMRGEYEVSFNKSYMDIVQLICQIEERSFDEEKEKIEKEIGSIPNPNFVAKFVKFSNEVKKFRLPTILDKDIIGLDDYTFENKYLFTVTCQSKKGQYFTIDIKTFDNIVRCNFHVRQSTIEFVKRKKDFLLDHLYKIKESCYYLFMDKNKRKEIQTEIKIRPITIEPTLRVKIENTSTKICDRERNNLPINQDILKSRLNLSNSLMYLKESTSKIMEEMNKTVTDLNKSSIGRRNSKNMQNPLIAETLNSEEGVIDDNNKQQFTILYNKEKSNKNFDFNLSSNEDEVNKNKNLHAPNSELIKEKLLKLYKENVTKDSTNKHQGDEQMQTNTSIFFKNKLKKIKLGDYSKTSLNFAQLLYKNLSESDFLKKITNDSFSSNFIDDYSHHSNQKGSSFIDCLAFDSFEQKNNSEYLTNKFKTKQFIITDNIKTQAFENLENKINSKLKRPYSKKSVKNAKTTISYISTSTLNRTKIKQSIELKNIEISKMINAIQNFNRKNVKLVKTNHSLFRFKKK